MVPGWLKDSRPITLHYTSQVTAVLRNLADVSGSRDVFLEKDLLSKLVAILKIFKSDSDVVMNICRILR